MANVSTTGAFIGYWRATKRDRWRPVAEGPDAAACMDATLQALAMNDGDLVVLAAGTDPNAPPRRSARRRRL